MRSMSIRKAQAKYNTKLRQINLRLDKEKDREILHHLAAQPSMNAYIKRLIAADLEHQNGCGHRCKCGGNCYDE